MTASSLTNSLIQVKTTEIDVCGRRYELTQVSELCWYVVSLQTGRTWQLRGADSYQAWRKAAMAWFAECQAA